DLPRQCELFLICARGQFDARIRIESQRLTITPAADVELDFVPTGRRPRAILLLRWIFQSERRLRLRIMHIPHETMGAHAARERQRRNDPLGCDVDLAQVGQWSLVIAAEAAYQRTMRV